MAAAPEKISTDLIKRAYSDDEIAHIYELGRLFLENGSVKQAETIMTGLTEVVPDFAPAWLGLCYIHIQDKNNDAAIYAARQACRVDPELTEAMLFLSSCLLTSGDYNSAGTYLGEVGDKIDSGAVDNPNIIRFFKAQLARYQAR